MAFNHSKANHCITCPVFRYHLITYFQMVENKMATKMTYHLNTRQPTQKKSSFHMFLVFSSLVFRSPLNAQELKPHRFESKPNANRIKKLCCLCHSLNLDL
jgi:hypothetical protein